MKRWLVVLGVVVLLAGVAIGQRHWLLVQGLGLVGPPALLEPTDEGPDVEWFDDYFAVEALDERTFAILEPRYAQQNVNYLIAGDERAVLFDAGAGFRDIRPVVEGLVDVPVTFIPSHFHYDHVGNEVVFERVAVVDLPYLRERAPDGRLALTFDEHLGAAERVDAPTLVVDEWLAPGSTLDLGGRTLAILYTPGHTEDSISLLDVDSGQLFSGDFLCPCELYAFLPNSGLGDYLQGAETVIASAPSDARIHGAHRAGPPGAPEQPFSDVLDLHDALLAIRAGELEGSGFYPVRYPVNERVSILTERLHDWEPRRTIR